MAKFSSSSPAVPGAARRGAVAVAKRQRSERLARQAAEQARDERLAEIATAAADTATAQTATAQRLLGLEAKASGTQLELAYICADVLQTQANLGIFAEQAAVRYGTTTNRLDRIETALAEILAKLNQPAPVPFYKRAWAGLVAAAQTTFDVLMDIFVVLVFLPILFVGRLVKRAAVAAGTFVAAQARRLAASFRKPAPKPTTTRSPRYLLWGLGLVAVLALLTWYLNAYQVPAKPMGPTTTATSNVAEYFAWQTRQAEDRRITPPVIPTATPAPTATAVPTQAPTYTPAPTATPTRTPTLAPTSTVAPTATPKVDVVQYGDLLLFCTQSPSGKYWISCEILVGEGDYPWKVCGDAGLRGEAQRECTAWTVDNNPGQDWTNLHRGDSYIVPGYLPTGPTPTPSR